AEVFSAELLGDSALVTARLGKELIAVKAEKDCPARMGDVVGIAFDRAALHLFDGETGERLPDRAAGGATVTRLAHSKAERH
ncbi:MAG TPA: hypothetical protein PKA74_17835, partial [Bauldia sp.]|nr:hypothetical protein [Bauldia sp.]